MENYPKSGNVYVSYGDLMIAKNDTLKGIAYYEKALAVQDNISTRQKISALKSKEAFKVSAEDLKKYEGAFDMESPTVTVTIKLKENELWAEVPGEGEFQLLPASKDVFTEKT